MFILSFQDAAYPPAAKFNIAPLAKSLIPNAGFAGIQNSRFNIQDFGDAPVASSKIIGGLLQNTIHRYRGCPLADRFWVTSLVWLRHERSTSVLGFGLGLCTRAIFSGRIAIPIHNEKGELVDYCCRAVNNYQIKRTDKCKLPKNFVKSAVIYNTDRQIRKEDIYILAESFLIETAHPGYIGSQDTYYVGNLKGVGRIILNIFFKYKRT